MYAKEQKLDVISGTQVDFLLKQGGIISGYVRTESGNAMPGVRVEVESQSIKFVTVGLTDNNGYFQIEGLKTMDRDGHSINDYFVKIMPAGYASQTQGPIITAQQANFICVKRAENEISGTIQNESGNPMTIMDDSKVVIKAYRSGANGGFETKSQANPDGSFSIEALDPDATYQLKFILIENNQIIKSQWAGDNNVGVLERSNAINYNTSVKVYFSFSN